MRKLEFTISFKEGLMYKDSDRYKEYQKAYHKEYYRKNRDENRKKKGLEPLPPIKSRPRWSPAKPVHSLDFNIEEQFKNILEKK